MNQLVDQLLRVARLDAIALEDNSAEVDLSAVAAEEVALMAPLAITQGRTIAVVGAERPTLIKGNRHSIRDAIRNLIENAIRHTPPNTEVVVEIGAEGSVSVFYDRSWHGDPTGKRGMTCLIASGAVRSPVGLALGSGSRL